MPAAAPDRAGSADPGWALLAARARRRRRWVLAVLVGALAAASVPILLPYLWMLTIAASARTGSVDGDVLWRACAVLTPAAVAFGLARLVIGDARRRRHAGFAILALAAAALALLVGDRLHGENFRFLWTPDLMEELRGASGAGGGQFPSIWSAFANSLLLAGAQTALVVATATLAGYGISRLAFRGRAGFLQSLLALHAFPAMTLVIPIFLLMHWTDLLDSIAGVVLVVCTLELPFAIFILKGFFDAVPWEIEMSAMTDGASRRQAFARIVLPQVKGGILAVAVFAFIKGWEEYVFVRTLLIEKTNWVMSLYLFWVADDAMGVDYGIVAAVGVFYIAPGLLLYLVCQKYLTQLNLGGIKG